MIRLPWKSWVTGARRWLFGSGAFDEIEIMRRLLPPVGTMLDVGAHHGSAMAPFVASGWRVHGFEPDPANRARLIEGFGANALVTIDPRAVSASDGDRVDLFSSSVSTGISSLLAFHDSHKLSGSVETVTLATYCRQHGIERVDFLKVDAEGLDLFVLKGFDWSYRPRAILCEFEDRKTTLLGYTLVDIVEFLVSKGYLVVISEWHPVIEYGSEHRWRAMFPWNTRAIHPEAWGNVLAVRDYDDEAQILEFGDAEAVGVTRRVIARRVARKLLPLGRRLRWKRDDERR